jgi:hypothetical protein
MGNTNSNTTLDNSTINYRISQDIRYNQDISKLTANELIKKIEYCKKMEQFYNAEHNKLLKIMSGFESSLKPSNLKYMFNRTEKDNELIYETVLYGNLSVKCMKEFKKRFPNHPNGKNYRYFGKSRKKSRKSRKKSIRRRSLS